ncbi:MAG: tetratricopeptide repeat protein [bacterium]
MKNLIVLMLLTFVTFPSVAIDVKFGDKQLEVMWSPPKYNLDRKTGLPDPKKPVNDLFHYNVYRRSVDDPLAPWIKINRQIIPNYQHYYIDTDLINKRPYFYYVTAVDYAGNESPPSRVVSGVPGRGFAPHRITSLRAWSTESGIVELEWEEVTDRDNNIDVYRIYRDLTEIKEEYLADIMRGRPTRYLPVAAISKSEAVNGIFHYKDVGLPNGTIYYYGVTALDLDKNEGKASNTIGVRVFGVDIVPPFVEKVSHDAIDKPLKAGKVLMVTSTGEAENNVTYDLVKWPENDVVRTSTGPIENRPMQAAAQPGMYFALETVTVDFPNDVSILPRVYYIDPAGNSAPMLGDTTMPIKIDTVLPEKISVISGMVEDHAVKLSWADVDEDVVGYKVYRSGSVINGSALDTNNIISGGKLIKKQNPPISPFDKGGLKGDLKDSNGFLHFVDYDPIPTETYFYAVTSVDEADNENVSGNLEFTIPDIDGPPAIYSVTENTVGAPKKAGNSITLTVRGEPGKKYEIKNRVYETKAYFSIIKNDSVIVEEIDASEILIGDRRTGNYEGNYIVKSSDEVDSAQVIGYLVEPFGLYETSLLCSTYITMVGISSDTIAPEIREVTVEPVYTNLDGRIPVLSDEREQYLVAGNELKITLKGESGGVAYFDLGTMRRNVRMTEDADNPGTYHGSYKIMQGDKMNPVKVTCYLVDRNGNMSNKTQSVNYKIDTIIIVNMDRSKGEVSTNETDPIEVRTSVITATLRDRHNNALKNRQVEFRLVGGYGDMNPLVGVTDSDGKARSTYTGGYVVETGYIAAEDRSTGYAGITYVITSKTGTVSIILEALTPAPGQPRTSNGIAYISLRAKPLRIEANGRSVSVISAFLGYIGDDQIINDPYSEDYEPDPDKLARDIPIGNVEVKFLIRDYIEDFKRTQYYGIPKTEELELKRGKIEVIQPVTDQNGEAKAIYTSGTKAGLTIIQAVAPNAPGGTVGETIGLVLISGGVRYLLVEARPIGTPQNPVSSSWGEVEGSAQNSRIKADGAARAQIKVILLDSYENPASEIKVYFTCDIGRVIEEGNGLTGNDGKAYAVYTAPLLQNGGIGHVNAKVTSLNPLEEGLVNFNLGNKKMIEDRLDVDDIAAAVKSYQNAAGVFEAVAAGYPYERLIYPLASKKWTLEEQERAYPDMVWNDDMLYVLGYTYELLENYETSIIHYNEVIDFYFGGSWADNANFRKGQVYEEQSTLEQDENKRKEYIDEAMDAYENLIYKFDTSNLADNAMFQMGRIYEQKEFYPKAIETYRKLIRDYRDSDLVNYSWYSIGQCYEQLGQKDEAIEAYQRIFGPFDDLIYKLAQEKLGK